MFRSFLVGLQLPTSNRPNLVGLQLPTGNRPNLVGLQLPTSKGPNIRNFTFSSQMQKYLIIQRSFELSLALL